MDQLRRIEIIVRVAEAGSFARAARALLLDPSAVSHAIAQLERELDVRLVYRTTRQLRLTTEGEEVVRRGRVVLDHMAGLRASVRDARQRLTGTLKVGLPSGIARHIVMPRIAAFMQQHPGLQLQLMSSGSVREMHVSGADVNIRVGPLADSSLVARPLATFRFGVYASPGYLRQHGTPRSPQDLARHRCLIHKSPRSATLAPWNHWSYSRGNDRGTVEVTPAFVTDDREALLVAAEHDAGVFRIGMFSPELIRSGRLIRLLTEWQWTGAPGMSLVYRRQSPQPRRIAAFIDFMAAATAAFDPEEITLTHEP